MQNKNYSKTLTTQKTRFFTALHNKFSNYFTNCIAFIFYKLNKPLPHTYQFYFITHHATGHNAMMDFLKHCGISINGDIQNINALQRYKQNYKRLARQGQRGYIQNINAPQRLQLTRSSGPAAWIPPLSATISRLRETGRTTSAMRLPYLWMRLLPIWI